MKVEFYFLTSNFKTDFIHYICWWTTIISVLGQEEGYTVKHAPEPKGFADGTACRNPEGSGTCFTVYPDLSPSTDIIPFLNKDLLSFWVQQFLFFIKIYQHSS